MPFPLPCNTHTTRISSCTLFPLLTSASCCELLRSQLAAYAQSQVGDVSVAEYLQHVQTVLSREKAMAESFFHPSTTVKHEYSVWKALFADAHNDLLTREPGLLNMLNLAYSDNDVAKVRCTRGHCHVL